MTSSDRPAPGNLDTKRLRMVDDQIARRGVKDPLVLDAMRTVKRHLFVPDDQIGHAHEDYPLPIGHGQTISQPYIVAVMTEQIEPRKDSKVLEVGTGSGYQAAVLAHICREVFTVEAMAGLADAARLRLEDQGYRNVRYRVGDGSLGWPEEAPFDGILVTAAAPEVPGPLREQLRVGGVIVIPLGDRLYQDLVRARKVSEDGWEQETLFPCAFVPLVGEYGFREPFR
jgi:protein-L-isoaspartate(D-aspartate) O-methyltransferase